MVGGFWVDEFIGIGSGEVPGVLTKGFNKKYGITGYGDVEWIPGMLVECDQIAQMISTSQGPSSALYLPGSMPGSCSTTSPQPIYWLIF